MPQETSDSFPEVDPAPLSSAIGEFWSLAQTAIHLQLTEAELVELVKSNRVLGVVTADDQRLFPAFQFRNKQVIPTLEPVLSTVLAATNGWEATQWLMTPIRRLGNKTPVEIARCGDDRSQERLLSYAEKQAKDWQNP